jgi:DNA-binding response OmpR family regulator
VIIVVSSHPRESTALLGVCESRGWTSVHADSIHRFVRLLRRWKPKIIIVRQKLHDGYSDDAIAAVDRDASRTRPKFIVLIPAGASSTIEARQVALGADAVFRDPVRTDVLTEYLAKYMATAPLPPTARATSPAPAVSFGGASLFTTERVLVFGKKKSRVTPREVELIELLVESQGSVVSYEMLYSEILDRKFQGDTVNMRVLLRKVAASAKRLGIDLKDWVQVIPKYGYRYGRRNSV